jgi:monoamine oxidase
MGRITRRRTLSLLGTAALASFTLPARGTAASDADLIVIGAGLSGLYAARLAAAAGMKTIVLEAATRAGGRVLTLDDVPGKPNAGASQVGAGYLRLRALAAGFGLEMANDAGEARDMALSVGGQLLRSTEWATSSANPFPASLKPVTPGSMLFRLATAANPLRTRDDWRGPVGRSTDIAAREFLKAQGLDEEGLRLVDIGLNANALASYSMLNVWRTLLLFREDAALGPPGSIKGGAQRLTDAMAASTPDLRLGNPVAAIEATPAQVEVALADGSRLRAPFAICSLPFSILRTLPVTGATLRQRTSVDSMAYTQIAHIYFEPASRFWDTDGLPPDTWTDGPLERVFAVRDRDTGQPNGLMLAWLNGHGAAWIRGKSDTAIAEIIARELPKARPAAKGPIRVVRTVRWTDENPLAGGAYMHFAPGQAAAWADTMAAPAGRLHFAGEHLSRVATGMEGALESAETAITAILQPGPSSAG